MSGVPTVGAARVRRLEKVFAGREAEEDCAAVLLAGESCWLGRVRAGGVGEAKSAPPPEWRPERREPDMVNVTACE